MGNIFSKPGLGKTQLPPVSEADNGKVLSVVDGAWDKADASGGSSSDPYPGYDVVLRISQDSQDSVFTVAVLKGEGLDIKGMYDGGIIPTFGVVKDYPAGGDEAAGREWLVTNSTIYYYGDEWFGVEIVALSGLNATNTNAITGQAFFVGWGTDSDFEWTVST